MCMRAGGEPLSYLALALLLVGRGQVFAGFVLRAGGIVWYFQRPAILVDRAIALACDVEELAQLHVAPDLGPLGLAVAALGGAILIGRGLVVVLLEENFGNAIMRQRTELVDVQRFLQLNERGRQIALLH